MVTQIANHEGTAVLTLTGRCDTLAAQELMGKLDQLLIKAGRIDRLVVDADKLEYISGSYKPKKQYNR